MDILDELDIEPPETWTDLYSIIPVLQENGYDVGLPTPTGVQSGSISTDLNTMFAALLLQNGGRVYTDDGHTALGDLVAVNSFIQWTEFYTKYNVSKSFSAINRFRTGEMPILLSSYNFYNTLVVGAPEINGLWEMMPIPGTLKEGGVIDRSASSTITSIIMFKNARDPKAAWEFMKWWTSEDGQTAYGLEIEALQGESARWPTANKKAMANMPWRQNVGQMIQEQWQWVVGIPEVAGSYYVGRSVDNAIKSVINSKTSPLDTYLDAVEAIDSEIRYKRKEFGLE